MVGGRGVKFMHTCADEQNYYPGTLVIGDDN